MSNHPLVVDFYDRIWNVGDASAIPEILCPEFAFRASLGAELIGHTAFWDYVCGVRAALADYRCNILACVSEGNQAFARMHFAGIHVGDFRGFSPTQLPVHWNGAALFRFSERRIRELWVLGDLVALDALLKANSTSMITK